MALILKGVPVAKALCAELLERSEKLRKEGRNPVLCILRQGNRPEDLFYEKSAEKKAEAVGIEVRKIVLPEGVPEEDLLSEIEKINRDDTVHGCLMFRPLSDRETEKKVCGLLAPEKDVDCMTYGSVTGVFSGKKEGFPPCTAQAVLEILDYYGIPVSGKKTVVIGRSLVVGKPVAMMLLGRDATVTVCHRKTPDLAGICRTADLIVTATGAAGLVTKEFLRPGQILIDVGISEGTDGKITGDVCFDDACEIAEAVTPVPGGVGSVTTAVLLKHVMEAAEKQWKQKGRDYAKSGLFGN